MTLAAAGGGGCLRECPLLRPPPPLPPNLPRGAAEEGAGCFGLLSMVDVSGRRGQQRLGRPAGLPSPRQWWDRRWLRTLCTRLFIAQFYPENRRMFRKFPTSSGVETGR
jgi:hypothetical protein